MYRIMVVDDEDIIRKGIINFIDWADLDCMVIYEAKDGMEARDKLESLAPDIVITDIKMPRMNGIELSEYIHLNHPNIKVIILTAYADFSYAQSAIKFGVVDYAIKTNPTEFIKDAVIKAKKSIHDQREKEKNESKISSSLNQLKEKMLQDIINGVLSDENEIRTKMDGFGINFGHFFILIFEIDNSLNYTSSMYEKKMFPLSIKNFLSLAFKEYPFLCVTTSSESFCILVQITSNTNEHLHSILTKCEEVSPTVDNFMKFKMHIGISNPHKGFEEIQEAYNEALQVLTERFYNEKKVVFVYRYDSYNKPSLNILQASMNIDGILENIKTGDINNAKLILNSLLELQKDGKQPVELIKTIGIMLYSQCSKFLIDYSIDLSEVLGSNTEFYLEILECKTIISLSDALERLIEAVCASLNSVEKQNNYLIGKIMKYIKENYKDEIALQHIADYVHMNSSYVSRLFSKETGNTITDAINSLRIEKAKELLCRSNLKTFEIASEVGINDSTYFSHLFKKLIGLSPKEYRQTNLKHF